MVNRFQEQAEEGIRACGEIHIERISPMSPVVQRADGKWEPVTVDDPRFKTARHAMIYGLTSIRAANGASEIHYPG